MKFLQIDDKAWNMDLIEFVTEDENGVIRLWPPGDERTTPYVLEDAQARRFKRWWREAADVDTA